MHIEKFNTFKTSTTSSYFEKVVYCNEIILLMVAHKGKFDNVLTAGGNPLYNFRGSYDVY